MDKKLFALLFFFALPSLAQAMDFQFGRLTMSMPAPPDSKLDFRLRKAPRCQHLFETGSKMNMHMVSMGGPLPSSFGFNSSGGIDSHIGDLFNQQVVSTSGGETIPFFKGFFDTAASYWPPEKGYTPEKLAKLRAIDDQLPDHRKMWLQYQLDENYGGIPLNLPDTHMGIATTRIYDSSLGAFIVHGFDLVALDKGQDYRDPIELSEGNQAAGYRLPRFGRAPGLPVHRWHMGMTTNQKGFQFGLGYLFQNTAMNLDNSLNNAHYKTFKSTDRLDEMGMVIYSSTRPAQVEYFRTFGFEILDPETGLPVEDQDIFQNVSKPSEASPLPEVIFMHPSGQGQLTDPNLPLLPDGMVLIGISGSDFLRRYHTNVIGSPVIEFTDLEGNHIRIGPKDGPSNNAEDVFLEGNQKARDRKEDLSDPRKLRQYIQKVEILHDAYARALTTFIHNHPRSFPLNDKEQDVFKRDSEWKSLVTTYRRFAIHFYALINNVPGSLRDSHWKRLDMIARSLLEDYPLEAWDSLKPNQAGTRPEIYDAMDEWF